MGHNRDLERFEAKFVKTDGCWEWGASKKGGGYGAFYLNGKLEGAHRASVLLYRPEESIEGLNVCHSCDNPSCVNPAHLFVGTQFTNMRDASKKGRIRNVNDWSGTKNPKSKLCDDDYLEIKALYESGLSRKKISEIFHVSSVRVGQVLKSYGLQSKIKPIDALVASRKNITHCKRWHEFTKSNTRINKSSGGRVCLACENLRKMAAGGK